MAGAAPEGNQYDERRYDSKMTELLGDGDDFFTSYDEVCDSFDALGLQENLLRGIYAYGHVLVSAQVYYSETWDVGYALSLSYDVTSDNFHDRYPPHGKWGFEIEKGIEWERVRAKPVDISPYQLYIPNCVNDLHPGDHVEAQWRRNKVSPFGWWYGVVGHLEACNANESHCQCHNNDTVVLEFEQYAVGSRWRRASVARKGGEEEGNRVVGFYGGFRKLYTNEDVALWERFRPPHILE